VTGELRSFSGGTEFLFVGSWVHSKSPSEGLFTSAGDAQELFCHMDASYEPVQHVFGNVAYSIGVGGGGILGSLKTLARCEIQEFSDAFNRTRHAALDRAVGEARRARANSVVGIRTTIQRWAGTHEMMMAGTAAFNPAPPCVGDRHQRPNGRRTLGDDAPWLRVSSRILMEHSCRVIRRMRYGPGSSWGSGANCVDTA
jgi:uncharacterized protein YbjQ (UPF0145 family)